MIKSKKWLAALLAAVMCVVMLPVAAFAAPQGPATLTWKVGEAVPTNNYTSNASGNLTVQSGAVAGISFDGTSFTGEPDEGTIGSTTITLVDDADSTTLPVAITVDKGSQTIDCADPMIDLATSPATAQLVPAAKNAQGTAIGDTATFTYGTSSDPTVATVDASGLVTGVGVGTATITIDSAATTNYEAAQKTVTVTVSDTSAIDVNVVSDFGTWTGAGDVSAVVDYTHSGTVDVALTRGSNSLSSTDFSFEADSSGTKITINEAYLQGLSNGTYAITATVSDSNISNPINDVNINLVIDKPTQPGGGQQPGGQQPGDQPAGIDYADKVLRSFNDWNGSGNVTARIDVDFAKFVKLTKDGQDIDASSYSAESGSTVITLNESYLKTLSAGTHTIRAQFNDGYVDLTLKINAAGSGASTGERSMMFLLVLMGSAMLVAGVLVFNKKRQIKSTK